MTAHELLSQLRAKGVAVKTSGDDRLVIDAPKGTITEELRTALSANKVALLKILKDEEAATTEVPETNEGMTAAPPPPSEVAAVAEAQPPVAPPVLDEVAASTAEE